MWLLKGQNKLLIKSRHLKLANKTATQNRD